MLKFGKKKEKKEKPEPLNFRKELLETLSSKSYFPKTKKYAEDFLRETLQKTKETDDKDISKLNKIDFMCTEISIIVCLSKKTSGIYSCTSYEELTKEVFEEIRSRLKFEGLIIPESEKEDSFSIMIP